MWNGWDKKPFLCPQGDSQMTKEGLEPLSWQSDSLGSSGTRAPRNQEGHAGSPAQTLEGHSVGSGGDTLSVGGATASRQGWQLPGDREDMLPKQLPKSVRGRTVLSPSPAPALRAALPGLCGKEWGEREEGRGVVSVLYKLLITDDRGPRGRPSQV